MCFGGGGGPTEAEEQSAAEQRVEAEDAQREEAETRAEQKRKDISDAFEASVADAGARGGAGRRSLFRGQSGRGAGGSAGYLGRFD